MNETEYAECLQRKFACLKEKKILIYGTGKFASKLVKGLPGFDIVGILDRVQVEGIFENIPILSWDDVSENTADVVILATSKKNYKVIFERIQYLCAALEIEIYGESGQNLTKEYRLRYMEDMHMIYFEKNKDMLEQLIDSYDAISFDLFDTLIMRKTLEPADVFTLVEDRIREKGLDVPCFRKKRRTAELHSYGKNIHYIYHVLKDITGISEDTCTAIKQEEIECEKQCLIPRNVMVEIMDYALRKGKRVNIISDMYLPGVVLEPMLNAMGISGYQKLYVSCDYGVGKGNGLFEIYRRDVGEVKCLHIGDNFNSDVIAAKRYGIDAYEIKSALEMLKISSLRKLLLFSESINNRVVLGLILSELFNDPFLLYGTAGFIPVRTQDILAKLFIAPTVLIYMQKLEGLLKTGDYEGILFTARDGYLFKKLYEKWYEEKYHVPAVYFLASRKLCLSLTLDSDESVLDLCRWLPTKERMVSFVGNIVNSDNFPTMETSGDMEKYLFSIGDQLKHYSSVMRGKYKKYTDGASIDWNKKYLLCDLVSGGTIQGILEEVFSAELDGFYLCKKKRDFGKKIHAVSVYDEEDGADFGDVVDLLETVLTSQSPSVTAMDENGCPIYVTEKRSREELNMVDKMQYAIMEFVGQYDEIRGLDQMIAPELPETILGLFHSVKYESENEFLTRLEHVDDLGQSHTDVVKLYV